MISPVYGRELSTRINMLLRAREASVLLYRERQTLRESEALFRSLAENANAIIGIVQDNKSSL